MKLVEFSRAAASSLAAIATLLLLSGGCHASLQCKITTDPKNPADGVSPNTNVTLTCSAFGGSAESFVWKKAGKLISNDSQSNASSSLIIRASHSSEIEYKCLVREGGKDHQCTHGLKVNVYGKPVLKGKNSTVYTDGGEPCEISCEVTSGWPKPEPEWTVRGGVSWGPFTVERRADKRILVRKGSAPAGITLYSFQCTATNAYGTASKYTSVQLHGPHPTIRPPPTTIRPPPTTIRPPPTTTRPPAGGSLRVESRNPRKEVQLGETVTMECVATYPFVATLGEFWTLNGAALNTSDERYTREKATQNETGDEQRQGTRFSLTIHNVKKQDMGLYECGVNTTLGVGKASVELQQRPPIVITTNPKADSRPKAVYRPMVLPAIIGCLTVGMVFIIAIAAGLLYKRNARGSMKLGTLESKPLVKYDVFVTFSGKDAAWVEEELVPVLEQSRLKFCIHNRDFELGKPFVDNMIDSVYSSRKVLAVVSRNYMASNFCRGELDMALQRSVEENADASLVLLRLDDVPRSKLPKSLRGKTFLDYHDPEERCGWASRLVKTLAEGKGEACA